MSNIPLCIYHILFIRSSVDGHLGCFHVWAIVNSAAIYLLGCMYPLYLVFSVGGVFSEMEFAGSYSDFQFFEVFHTVFPVTAIPTYSPTKVSLFSHPCQHLLFVDFWIIAILTHVKCYLIIAFIRISPIISDVGYLLMCLLASWMFGRRSIQVFCPFFWLSCFDKELYKHHVLFIWFGY